MALPLVITDSGATWIGARIADNQAAEIDRLTFHSEYFAPASVLRARSTLPTAAKTFTALVGDTGADGSFAVAARDSSNDAYTYHTIGVWVGTTLVAAYSTFSGIRKAAERDLVVEVGFAVSDLTVGGQTLTLTVTGVNRATDSAHGTVRLMTAAEVAAGGAADAVPTGNDVATLAALVAPNARLARFTANGTWAKPANAKFCLVQAIGAGAAGASGRQDSGVGGKSVILGGVGGQVKTQLFRADALPASVPITVAPSTAPQGSDVRGGADSLFGTILKANGGCCGWGGEFTPQGAVRAVLHDGVSPTTAGGYINVTDANRLGGADAGAIDSTGGAAGDASGGATTSGRDGSDTTIGIGAGGGAQGSVVGAEHSGGNGGAPGGGGGAGLASPSQGGSGARGEVRIWSW